MKRRYRTLRTLDETTLSDVVNIGWNGVNTGDCGVEIRDTNRMGMGDALLEV